MADRSVLILCVLVFGNALYQVESVLKTTFIEDLCYNTQNSVYDLRYDTSGVLMSAPKLYPTEGFQCEVVFSPPKGASVVLSIYRYDLFTDDVLIIEDSDRHRVALMERGVFKEEKKSVISEGKLRVFYKTGNKTSVHMNAGFQFTFTKVMKSPCSSNEFKCKNDHCVLKEYVCDGHNHCGDNSDQKKCDSIRRENKVEEPYMPSQKHSSSVAIWVSLLAIASLIVGSVIVITIVVLVRRAKKKKENSNINNIPQVGGNSVPRPALPQQISSARPLQSVSTTVHHNNNITPQVVGNPTVRQQTFSTRPLQSVSATVHHHNSPVAVPVVQDSSMYNRARRSLRGARTQPPRVVNVPREQNAAPVRHQVPSMYPSLDQIPSAPEMHGVDNPEFKADEIDLENLTRNLTRLLRTEATKR